MKLYSWNVNGIRAVYKRGDWKWFTDTQPDVLCLQETKAEPEQLDAQLRDPDGYHSYFSWSKGRKGYSGTAIYTKILPDKVEYGMGIPRFDDEGRIVVCYFGNRVLCNVYFPNGGGGPERLQYKLDFYDAFLEFVLRLKLEGKDVVFCGDVNTAHTAIDLARPKENEQNTGFLPIEREWLDEVVRNGFIDTFRYFYPHALDSYTYWDTKTRARERNVGWRIDYFFVSPALVGKLVQAQIQSEVPGSDHCPLMIELKD